jgi:hypothetical protein
MVVASVDNQPVTETISSTGTTVTVPAGEVWKVNVTLMGRRLSSDQDNVNLEIDGVKVGGIQGKGAQNGAEYEMVLQAGQTVGASVRGFDAEFLGIYISGFRVQAP